MPPRNARSCAGPPRAALAAVVSHSSSRRRVTPRRTSVIADRVQPLARLVGHEGELQPDARRRRLQILGRRRAGRRAHDCSAPRAAQELERDATGTGTRAPRAPTAVQTSGWPGSTVQPSTSSEQRRRRQQAAPEVVENLPARDERQAIALQAGARRHERKQPPQDLPVAAHPAVLPPRVREHARRVVVHDLDVGHERRARVEALEQIVRQQRVLRHASVERRGERVDVVQSLAGEDALVEEILVDVGDGGRVRIDAGVAGVRAREERSRRARHRHADARLQDAVARR